MRVRATRFLTATLAVLAVAEAASACQTCHQTPCVVAPVCLPAYQCVTEMVPYTVYKQRKRIEFETVTETIMVKVADTQYIERQRCVNKPVWDTQYVQRDVYFCRPIHETIMVDQQYTVCKPVSQTGWGICRVTVLGSQWKVTTGIRSVTISWTIRQVRIGTVSTLWSGT